MAQVLCSGSHLGRLYDWDLVTVSFKNDASAPTTGILTTVVSGTNAGDFLVTSDGCTGK